MFGKLKEKLKSWTKKVRDESELVELSKKEIKIPTRFNYGYGTIEPDLEKLGEIKKELEEEISPGTKSFFEKVASKISKIKITDEGFEIYAEELEMLLLENNVALEVAEKIIRELKEEIVGKELLKKEVEEEIKDSLKNIIEKILIEPFDIIEKIKEKKNDQTKEPYVILFCGINGTGKTTSIAKIAKYLQAVLLLYLSFCF